MAAQGGDQGRVTGMLLVAMVATSLVMLGIDAALSVPAPDGSIEEFRDVAADHAAVIRWRTLIPVAAFVGFFLPASVGLRDRLRRSASRPAPGLEILVPAAVLLAGLAIAATAMLATLGLVPAAELSESVLRTTIMVNHFMIWIAVGLAVALFVAAASNAMAATQDAPRWLIWWGQATAAASAVGAVSIGTADFGGPLFALAMLARGAFLVWLIGTGVWLTRSPSVALAPAVTSATA